MKREELQRLADALEGLPVWGCLPGSASDRAGIGYGDVVLEVNGVRTKTVDEYMEARARRRGRVTYKIFRAGREIEVELPLEATPPAAESELN